MYQIPNSMTQSRTFKAAVLGSGQFFVALTALVSVAVLSRILTKTGYAAYRQTLLAFVFVAPLLKLGLPQALYYFLPRDKENGRSILSGNLLLLFSTACVFAAAMWCGGNEVLARRFGNPALSQLLLTYSFYALLALPVTAISACLVSCNRVKTLTIYNVASRVVVVACVIGLTLIWRSPEVAISGAVIAAFLVFFPAMFLMYRSTNGDDWRPTRMNMWAQMKYSVPLGVAGMIGAITMNLDKVLVSSMCKVEEFAVYVNGAIEIPLIWVVTGSVTAVLLPEFSVLWKEKNTEKMLSLWHSSIKKVSMIIIPIGVFLMVMSEEFMTILFSRAYVGSAIVFRIYLLLIPLRTTTFASFFLSTGHTGDITKLVSIELFMNLLLSIVLIKRFGMLGAAVATVIVEYITNIGLYLWRISKVIEIPYRRLYPYGWQLKTIGLFCVPGLLLSVSKVILPSGAIVQIVVGGIAYFAFSAGLLILTGRIPLHTVTKFLQIGR